MNNQENQTELSTLLNSLLEVQPKETDDEIIEKIEQLLMNKYVITENDRKMFINNVIYKVRDSDKQKLANLIFSFSYPLTQEEFNICYNQLQIDYVKDYKFDINQYISVLHDYLLQDYQFYRSNYIDYKEHGRILNEILENNKELINELEKIIKKKSYLFMESSIYKIKEIPILYDFIK